MTDDVERSQDVTADPAEALVPAPEEETTAALDPRVLLAAWANENDEWVRYIVGGVIQGGVALTDAQVDRGYEFFRQEKGLDGRTFPPAAPLALDVSLDETAPALEITKLSEVQGVNALVPGGVIEPHSRLTIIYGENGTGKTGYARIFKALAQSRTDDDILGDINAEATGSTSARLNYTLGGTENELAWEGDHGVAPFTRMFIFDNLSVNYHVDGDLDYVYVPASLALFNHVSAAIRGVQDRIDGRINALSGGTSGLLTRFPRESSVYTDVETLGAATSLEELKAKADWDPNIKDRLETLRRAVSALQGDNLRTQIQTLHREARIQAQGLEIAEGLRSFDTAKYNELLDRRTQLSSDYETFRKELFAAASLPAEPEETWQNFVVAADAYRRHLVEVGAHDADHCLYCRQTLEAPARDLLAKYSSYLEDKISTDLGEVNSELRGMAVGVQGLARPEVEAFLAEQEAHGETPTYGVALATVVETRQGLYQTMIDATPFDSDLQGAVAESSESLSEAHVATTAKVTELQTHAADQVAALTEKKTELAELTAAAELGRAWTTIGSRVRDAKEADQLTLLKRGFRGLLRGLTDLAKEASDQLINQNFEGLFLEECKALRAPELTVEFRGRDGQPRRRKTLSTESKPSLVLSEGEQKVLAIADFLAEASLAGITAPVIFDDPVSSLDHRRVKEVAERLTLLAQNNQVIVFTHDILFATTLYALAERPENLAYFEISDAGGKGNVTRGTHPAADSIGNIRGDINRTIQAAKATEGQAQIALIKHAYSRMRAFCEVFAEQDLLAGVSRRFEPNIRIGSLSNIKVDKLSDAIETVNGIFEVACGFTEAHSQPLPTLGVAPTIEGLEADWATLQECRSTYRTGG